MASVGGATTRAGSSEPDINTENAKMPGTLDREPVIMTVTRGFEPKWWPEMGENVKGVQGVEQCRRPRGGDMIHQLNRARADDVSIVAFA